MGVFVKEEVVSGSVFGNSAGQFSGFRRVGVDQLDDLLLYIQPLKHNEDNAQQKPAASTLLAPNRSRRNSARVVPLGNFTLTSSSRAHQLDVVDVFLGELLEGSLGRLLQREGQALKCLMLTLHTDLCLHLQVAASKYAEFNCHCQAQRDHPGIMQLYVSLLPSKCVLKG